MLIQKDSAIKFLLVILVVGLGVYFFPWRMIKWGSVTFKNERMVTVTGSAESKEKNQIARFSAGVQVTNDNKETAVKEVNTKMDVLLASVKEFGIDESDIQTQSMNIYQRQDMYYDGGAQKSRAGQWDVSNTIEIVLRDVDKAAALTDLLSKSGATNVYGPNFMMDNTKKAEQSLLDAAIADARVKAEQMAKAAGASLGEVISVNESGTVNSVYPLYKAAADGMGGGGSVVTPGSTTVSKSVTVVWSLK